MAKKRKGAMAKKREENWGKRIRTPQTRLQWQQAVNAAAALARLVTEIEAADAFGIASVAARHLVRVDPGRAREIFAAGGCTDDDPYAEGCEWVAPGLCSSCAPKNAREGAKRAKT